MARPFIALVALALAIALSAEARAQSDADVPAGADEDAWVLFTGLESEDAVAIVDPRAGEVLDKIPVGISTEDIEGVHALITSPDDEHYYISMAHGWPYGSVWKMTTAKDSLVARTNVGLFPATMAITPEGTWLFVANYNLHGDPALDTVSVIHTPTMTEVKQIPVCTKPHGMVASHDGRFVYASCTKDDVLKKISVSSLSVVDSTNMLLPEDRAEGKMCYPAALALTPDDEQALRRLPQARRDPGHADRPFGTITNRIDVGVGPYLMQIEPSGERLWVPHRNDESFSVIDVESETVLATRPSSATHPHTFAFGPDGTAYLSMESHAVVPGAIDVIDPETYETIRSIEVGLQATGVGAVRLPPSHFE